MSSSVRSLLGSKGKRYNDILAMMQQSSKSTDAGASEAKVMESGSGDDDVLQLSPSKITASHVDETLSNSTPTSSTPFAGNGKPSRGEEAASKDRENENIYKAGLSTRLPEAGNKLPSSSRPADFVIESQPGGPAKYTPSSETTKLHLITLQNRGERILKREYAPTMKHVVGTHKVSMTLAQSLLEKMESSLERQQALESEHINSRADSSKFSEDQLRYHLKLALEAEGREWLLNFVFGVLDGNDEDDD